MSAWTKVAKPIETISVSGSGGAEPIGMLMAITSVTGSSSSSIISGWTAITKPTSSVWTAITKPTS